jgi:hypothetical protein
MLYIYLFILIFLFGIQLWWGDVIFGYELLTFGDAVRQIGYVTSGILMYSYFLKSKDHKGLALVVVVTLGFIITTTIVTIGFLSNSPDAVRQVMAQGSDLPQEGIVIGTFGFFNAVVIMFPAFVFYLRSHAVGLPLKALIAVLVGMVIYPVAMASLTTTLLTSIAIFVIALFSSRRFQNTVIITVSAFLLIVFVFSSQTASLLSMVSEVFDVGSTLSVRIKDLSDAILIGDLDSSEGSTYLATERLSRVASSWDSFLSNPIIGGGGCAGHAYWVDLLARFGLLGFLPWPLIFWDQIRLNRVILGPSYLQYYMISFFTLIFLGCIKGGVVTCQTMLSIFFLVPGLYSLQCLRKECSSVRRSRSNAIGTPDRLYRVHCQSRSQCD